MLIYKLARIARRARTGSVETFQAGRPAGLYHSVDIQQYIRYEMQSSCLGPCRENLRLRMEDPNKCRRPKYASGDLRPRLKEQAPVLCIEPPRACRCRDRRTFRQCKPAEAATRFCGGMPRPSSVADIIRPLPPQASADVLRRRPPIVTHAAHFLSLGLIPDYPHP